MSSFRSKIIIAFIITVSLISSLSFYLYSNYLSKRILKKTEENTVVVFDLLNEPNRITCNTHNSQSFSALIDKLKNSNQIEDAFFINSKGVVKYPKYYNITEKDSALSKEITLLKTGLTFQNIESNKKTLTRSLLKITNASNCNNCHSSENKILGYIISDFSVNQTKENLNFTRKFSLSFTFFLIIILGSLVVLMHYRMVKSSLIKFQKTINIINHGNYNERVEIPKSKELGQLALSFNNMLEKFQDAKNQLYICHKKELEDKQKLATIGEMSARLAHEIRNPITGIANAIEIIVDETKEDQNKPILEEIKRQANRVNSAITNLLKYSKTQDITLKKGDINNLIKSIIFFFENQALDKEIIFKSNLYHKIPEFYFDNEQIENSLLNLSLNAMQAIEKKGFVKYHTELLKKENLILISIKDNGQGISKDKIEEIFKPFYTTKTEGTGLGLSITKDIIEKHNGKIKIESKCGSGTSIYIYLPFNHTI